VNDRWHLSDSVFRRDPDESQCRVELRQTDLATAPTHPSGQGRRGGRRPPDRAGGQPHGGAGRCVDTGRRGQQRRSPRSLRRSNPRPPPSGDHCSRGPLAASSSTWWATGCRSAGSL